MKYIVIKDYTELEHPIIFSEILDHASIVGLNTVVAAGFCGLSWSRHTGPEFSCWGKSVSLNGVMSRGEQDSRLLNKFFGL